MGEDKIQFRTVGTIRILKGKAVSTLIPNLLPELNGQNTISEVILRLKSFDENTVLSAIRLMNERGLLEDASISPPSGFSPQELERYQNQFKFFCHFHPDKFAWQKLLKEKRVVIFGLEEIGCALLMNLSSLGIGKITAIGLQTENEIIDERDLGTFFFEEDINKEKTIVAREKIREINPNIQVDVIRKDIKSSKDIVPLIERCDLVILCNDAINIPLCRLVNEACLEKKVQWINSSIEGTEALIGPLILPYETACYTCYELRRKGNEKYFEEYMAFEKYLIDNPNSNIQYGSLKFFGNLVATIVAQIVVKLFTNIGSADYGKLFIVNMLTPKIEVEEVLKLPICPTCSRAKPRPKLWLEME